MSEPNATLGTIVAFYPILCVVVFVPLTIAMGCPWLGIVLLILIQFYWRLWWTHLYGIVNALALYGGIIACLIPYLRMVRESFAN